MGIFFVKGVRAPIIKTPDKRYLKSLEVNLNDTDEIMIEWETTLLKFVPEIFIQLHEAKYKQEKWKDYLLNFDFDNVTIPETSCPENKRSVTSYCSSKMRIDKNTKLGVYSLHFVGAFLGKSFEFSQKLTVIRR